MFIEKFGKGCKEALTLLKKISTDDPVDNV